MALWDELAAALPSGALGVGGSAGGQLVPNPNPQIGAADIPPPGQLPPQWVNATVVRPAAPSPVTPEPAAPAALPQTGSMSGGTLADLLARARASGSASGTATGTTGATAASGTSGTSGATYDPASAKFGWGNEPPPGEASPLTEIPAGYGAPLGGLGVGLLANYLTGKYLAPKAYSAGKSIGQSSVGKLLADLERHLGISQAGKPQPMGSSPLTALLHLVGLGKSSPPAASSTASNAQTAQMAQAYANIAAQLQSSMADYMSGLSPAIQERFAPYMKNDELMALAILAGMQANPTAGLPASLVPSTTTTGTAATPTG